MWKRVTEVCSLDTHSHDVSSVVVAIAAQVDVYVVRNTTQYVLILLLLQGSCNLLSHFCLFEAILIFCINLLWCDIRHSGSCPLCEPRTANRFASPTKDPFHVQQIVAAALMQGYLWIPTSLQLTEYSYLLIMNLINSFTLLSSMTSPGVASRSDRVRFLACFQFIFSYLSGYLWHCIFSHW